MNPLIMVWACSEVWLTERFTFIRMQTLSKYPFKVICIQSTFYSERISINIVLQLNHNRLIVGYDKSNTNFCQNHATFTVFSVYKQQSHTSFMKWHYDMRIVYNTTLNLYSTTATACNHKIKLFHVVHRHRTINTPIRLRNFLNNSI